MLQDHGINPLTIGRVGVHNRILTIGLLTGRTREYVYVMDAVHQGRGVNEILAINEALAWGRDLRDGRHVYVFSDNDLDPGLPTQIYAFAIDGAAAGIEYRRQRVLLPVFGLRDFLRDLLFF